MAIRNPVEWGVDRVRLAILGAESANHGILPADNAARLPQPIVRR